MKLGRAGGLQNQLGDPPRPVRVSHSCVVLPPQVTIGRAVAVPVPCVDVGDGNGEVGALETHRHVADVMTRRREDGVEAGADALGNGVPAANLRYLGSVVDHGIVGEQRGDRLDGWSLSDMVEQQAANPKAEDSPT